MPHSPAHSMLITTSPPRTLPPPPQDATFQEHLERATTEGSERVEDAVRGMCMQVHAESQNAEAGGASGVGL